MAEQKQHAQIGTRALIHILFRLLCLGGALILLLWLYSPSGETYTVYNFNFPDRFTAIPISNLELLIFGNRGNHSDRSLLDYPRFRNLFLILMLESGFFLHSAVLLGKRRMLAYLAFGIGLWFLNLILIGLAIYPKIDPYRPTDVEIPVWILADTLFMSVSWSYLVTRISAIPKALIRRAVVYSLVLPVLVVLIMLADIFLFDRYLRWRFGMAGWHAFAIFVWQLAMMAALLVTRGEIREPAAPSSV